MTLRILFGPRHSAPTNPAHTDPAAPARWRAWGAGADTDVPVSPTTGWDGLVARLPPGWRPDAIAVWIAGQALPASVREAPVPVVGLLMNWRTAWDDALAAASACDLMLTSGDEAARLRAAGVSHAATAFLVGCDAPQSVGHEPEVDVLFAPELDCDRDESARWLAALTDALKTGQLAIASGREAPDRVARVVVAPGPELGPRGAAAVAAGAVLVRPASGAGPLVPGRDFIAASERGVAEAVTRCLADDAGRQAMVADAQARLADHSLAACVSDAIATSGPLPRPGAAEARRAGASRPLPPDRAVLARALAAPPAERGPLLAAARRAAPLHPLALAALGRWFADHGRPADALAAVRDGLTHLDALPPDVPLPGWQLAAAALPRRLATAWAETGWQHAGAPAATAHTRRSLLRAWLHATAAEAGGDLADYSAALLERPGDPALMAALGCALARAGRPADARRWIEAALTVAPDDIALILAYLSLLRSAGDWLALRHWQRRLAHRAAVAPGVWPAHPAWAFPPVLAGDELVSVIVVCHGRWPLTEACLASALQCSRPPFEIVVVDNASPDDTLTRLNELAARDGRVRVVANAANRGYPAACNQAVTEAKGAWVAFLNNDARVSAGWLEGLLSATLADGPPVGLVGATSNRVPDPQRVAAPYGDDLAGWEAFAQDCRLRLRGRVQEFPRLSGFCLLGPRSVLDAVGPMDEGYGLGFFDDDDLCLRMHDAGYRTVIAREVYVHHEGSASFRALGAEAERLLRTNWERFRAKWGAARTAGYRPPPCG